MFVARRNFFNGDWFKFGECPGCQRGALIGAVLGWGLVAMVVLGGDGMQLAIAAVLAATGMTVIWGVHRIAMAVKASRARRHALSQTVVVAPSKPKKKASVVLAEPQAIFAEPNVASIAEPDVALTLRVEISTPIAGKVAEPVRFDLTDLEWAVIQPVLPKGPQGVQRPDDRQVLNGILWRLRTGSAWTEIPERYGPYKVCNTRFNQWRKSGVWNRLLGVVARVYEGDIQMIDSAKAGLRRAAPADGVVKADPVAWVARQAA